MEADLLMINRDRQKAFAYMLPDRLLFREKGLIPIGAAVEGCPVGVCLVLLNGDRTASLEWIYVLEDYRRQGIGRAMLENYMDFALERGFEVLNLCVDPPDPEDFLRQSQPFFESMGFFLSSRRGNYQLTMEEIAGNKKLRALKPSKTGVERLAAYARMGESELKEFLKEKRIPLSALNNPQLCREASFACRSSTGEIEACLLTSKKGRGMGIDLLVTSGGRETAILSLLAAVFQYAMRNKENIDNVYVSALNPRIKSFLYYFFGKDFKQDWECIYGVNFLGDRG